MAVASPANDAKKLPERFGLTLWLLALNAAIGGFLFGYDTGSASASMLEMKLPRHLGGLAGAALTPAQQETVVSMVVLGAFVSAAVAGCLNQKLGRRKVLLLGSLLFTIGATGMSVAWDVASMIAARLVVGFGVGLCSHTVPLYISECAPAAFRGSLCFLNDMCVVLGQVSAAAVSAAYFYEEFRECWRWILGLAAAPSAIMFLGFVLMPESPRWLAMNDHKSACKEVLNNLRSGSSADAVETELQEIMDSVAKEKTVRGPGISKYFLDAAIRRPLLLGCSLQLVQQWVGINTIVYYGASILQKSNGNICDTSHHDVSLEDPFSAENKYNVALSIPINAAQLVGVFVSWHLVDRLGRRPLLLSSLVGIIASLVAMGVVSTFTVVPKAAVVVLMMLYLVFFGVGMSPVPWTINAEIYPMDVRAKCISFSTGTNWLMNYIVSQTFLSLSIMMSTSRDCPNGHPNGVFWLFGLVGIAGFIAFAFTMPETKGKSLEEISALFVDKDVKSVREMETVTHVTV